jgi:hypothetical protein
MQLDMFRNSMSHYMYMLFDMYLREEPRAAMGRTTKGLPMNTENENIEDNDYENSPAADSRPLGFWLRTVDAYISREFARAFEGEDVSRRDWMLLNALSGDVEVPGFAERIARKSKRLRSLEDRGWVEETGDGTWILTDEGRAARERLGEVVDGVRSRVAGAVSPEAYATTVASLEAIARELGWSEDERAPWMGFRRGFGRGRGFGPGFGPRPFGFDPEHRHGFGPGFGPGFRPGFRPGFGPEGAEPWGHHAHHEHGDFHGRGHGHGKAHHGHHGHHGESHDTETAYERGFEAGFRRGQAAS